MYRNLRRDDRNGIIGGVCAGLSEHFKIDVVIPRLIFIIGLFSTFPFALLYLVLWVITPKKIIWKGEKK